MKKFMPGTVLSHRFHDEVVKPLVGQDFPGLVYTAGLIDYGSDVLGFDTEVSVDHRPISPERRQTPYGRWRMGPTALSSISSGSTRLNLQHREYIPYSN